MIVTTTRALLRRRQRIIVILAIMSMGTSCSPSPRDVVPESRDVRVTASSDGGGSSSTNSDAYVYVARRPHGAVGLAESRNMKDEDARAMVDHIADDLERCAMNLIAQGLLVEGASRIVAIAQGSSGSPALNVKFAPGDAVAQNGLLCLVAPVRALSFPASTNGQAPGMAIEATWTPRGVGEPRKAQSPARSDVDAGG